jgi:hypothetical protein
VTCVIGARVSGRRRRADAELDGTIETTVADTADGPEVTLETKNQSDKPDQF